MYYLFLKRTFYNPDSETLSSCHTSEKHFQIKSQIRQTDTLCSVLSISIINYVAQEASRLERLSKVMKYFSCRSCQIINEKHGVVRIAIVYQLSMMLPENPF